MIKKNNINGIINNNQINLKKQRYLKANKINKKCKNKKYYKKNNNK
jgi:hypothetical protein